MANEPYENFNGTYTEHYNLAKPDGTDQVDIGVLNDNADKIDTAIYALEQELFVDEDDPIE